MASEGPKMSDQNTAGKRRHVTLTIPQRLEIIRWLEGDESRRAVTASYNIGWSTIYIISKQNDQLRRSMLPSVSVTGPLKRDIETEELAKT
jgi:hypothetical protein